MTARGFIRVETEDRLIEVFAGLDGFSTKPGANVWLVTAPPTTNEIPNRRLVVIGTPPSGDVELEGMASGHGPSIDSWLIPCGLVCTDIKDPQDAKRACQSALNAMADELARDDRLGMADGPRDLVITNVAGPFFGWDDTRMPTAFINFDISAQADIWRNP